MNEAQTDFASWAQKKPRKPKNKLNSDDLRFELPEDYPDW